MKIHTVTIENLNSLYGRHEIDFIGDLDQAPLFLIVGPTGAGKSTIMDAISLALFGMTPRLSGGHGQDDTDCRMIMSRGTGRCSAEVMFSKQVPGTPRTFYRARWEAWRSRDKPDGSFQPARRSLIQEDDQGHKAEVLANDTKKKIWGPVFEAVLEGMEPAEFQRSMLLAQGQFAAFLRASVAERAQVLERLTNTEQYQVIGARAMERFRAARSEVEKVRAGVGALEILDPAQMEQLARTLDAARASAKGSENRSRRARTLLDWARRDAALKHDHTNATERLTDERRRWDAQTINRERLAESNRCADAGEILRRAQALERERLQLSGTIDEALEERKSLTAELATSTKLEARLRGEHAARSSKAEVEVERFALAAESGEVIRRAADDTKSLASEHAAVDALSSRITTVRARLQTLQEVRAAEDEASDQITDREREASEALAALGGERTPDEYGRWLSEERDRLAEVKRRLASVAEQLRDLDHAIGVERRMIEEHSSLQAMRAGHEREHAAASEAKDTAATHQAIAQKLVETSARVIELEERRGSLVDGEECPLCGSTTHPFAVNPSCDQEAHDAHAEAESSSAHARRALVTASDRAATATVSLSTHAAREEASATTLARERDRLSALRERVAAAGSADGVIDAETLEHARAELGSCKDTVAESAETFARAKETARAAAAEVETLRNARAEQDRERIAGEASLQEIEETLALRVAEREEAARKLALSRSAAIKGLAQIGQRVPNDASVEELERALLDAFDGRAVEAARAEIERELSESAKAWESARKALSVLEVSVATVDAQITDRKGAHGRLHTRTETAGVALKEALDELGLSNTGELKTRVLSSTDRDLLQRNVDDVRGQFEQATGRADALAQQLTEHRELQPDGFVEGQAFETLETENREAAAALETHRQEVARVAAQQEEQERTRSRRAELIETLEEAEKEASLWNEMRLLIGSNDGGAFQRFAQTLNLSELVDRANVRLRELEPRYELVVATDSSGNPELAFAVRDHEHGGRERPQTTLSGGETFLVSLALALALSEYRQTQMPIETLLLDEGFGTLDPETLDIAMSALERLCATGGTQIGVISHVEGLRDRINAQIVVEKLGGGRSRLRATR